MGCPVIVGLAGLAGAGKTTVADAMAAFGFRRASFADPIRATLAALDPIVGWDPDRGPVRWVDAIEEHGYHAARVLWPEMRRLMQRHGTAAREIHGPDVWVDLCPFGFHADTVIDDVRFPNEIAAIRAAGGVVCWLERADVARMDDPTEQLTADLCDFTRHVTPTTSPRTLAGSVVHALGEPPP